MKPIYKRVLIKLSGEALGENGKGFCAETIEKVASEVVDLAVSGLEVALVIGGGNIWRGREGAMVQMDRATADYMGMLATVLNALAVQDAIERLGVGRAPDGGDVQCRVQTAIEMRQIAEPYIRRRAVRHLEKGRVVILAAGTGNPYFTTDTTAALRACELNVDCLMKATKVDGVYDSDPTKNPDAKRFDRISYMDVLSKGLNVMDSTATSLCMDNHMPMIVFDLMVEGNISRALKGENVGTTVE